MKHLLNENLNTLRIANIQGDKREWEEFIQSLYEIHLNKFSEDQLLTEGFLDKVKDTFKKATDDSKKYLKYSFNSFKKNAKKPFEFVKDIGDVFQGVNITSAKDLKSILKLAKIYSLSKGLNEADEKAVEISSVEEMEKLKPGQKFIWKGKDDRSFPASNFKNLPDGLISGEEYIQAFDEVNNAWLVSNTKEAARIENTDEYKSGGIIQKIGDFFRKNKWLTAAMVAPVLASATVGGNPEGAGQLVKAITGDDVNIDNNGVPQTGSNPDSMGDDDGDGLTNASGGDDIEKQTKKVDLGTDSPDSTDGTDIQKFKDNAKKLLPDENFDDVTTALKFKTGEYKLDQTAKKSAVENQTKSTLKLVEKEIAENGVTEEITIDQVLKGHISSNAGDNDNVANDGTDLAKGRLSTIEDITKTSNEQVSKIIKDKLGIDVKFNTKTVADSDVEGQVQHDAVDNSADQSSTVETKIATDGGKKIGTIKKWQPVVAVTGKGGSDMGQRVDIPGGSGSGKDGETRTTSASTTSGETPISVGDATPEMVNAVKKSNLNRNQEIFSVLKMMNPNIKGDPLDKTYKSWYPTTKKIVIQLRKSPDILLNKVKQITGVDIPQRAKSTGSFKRSGIAESLSLSSLLSEAAIDAKLNTIGITDAAIKKNQEEVIATLMLMYNLGTADVPTLSKLSTDSQEKIADLVGETDDKLTSTKPADVVTVEKDIKTNSSLKTALSRINTYDEFEALILGMAALVNPNLAKSKQNIKTVLRTLSDRIKNMNEESKTPSDTQGVYKIIDTLKILKTHLDRINTRKEFEELIFAILPFIDKTGQITQNKSRLAQSILRVTNRNALRTPDPIDLDKLGK